MSIHTAYIQAASGFFKMTKAFRTSTLNSEPDRDDEVIKRFHRVRYWPLSDELFGVANVRNLPESRSRLARFIGF
jgi:hypothetical protein